MTEAKRKADELIEKYKDYVHGYIGSSMLSNYEYPDQIIKQASKCALICVEEIIKAKPFSFVYNGAYGEWESKLSFWQEVRDELNKMK